MKNLRIKDFDFIVEKAIEKLRAENSAAELWRIIEDCKIAT